VTNIIGTCSLCGGRVVVPMHSVNPTPVCETCGALAARPYGPFVPMQPKKRNEGYGPSPYDAGVKWGGAK